MATLAHHMAVELLGREFSPHGIAQHVCVFAALGFIFATSTYGCWAIYCKAREAGGRRDEV